MMHKIVFGLLIFSQISLLPPAFAEPALANAPDCPPDPREQDVPELLFTFANLDEKRNAEAIEDLRKMLPEWIEKRSQRLHAIPDDQDKDNIFEGELFMAYHNRVNVIRGYAYKLEYLAADGTTRAEKEQAFCSFIKNTILFD